MFDKNDQEYLLRALGQNQVVLFLGAGFSRSSKNRLGASLPIGSELSAILWKWLGYSGDYDGTPLPDLYEAALVSGRGHSEISEFLETHLLCGDVPKEYEAITKAYWFRIYTTNIDDLLEQSYQQRSEPRLSMMSYPSSEPVDRDPTLSSVQAIYLNGRLPCRPDQITFSVRQYARRAMVHDSLYEQFIRDYATHPTIFIGTELNEPLFWQYIEARGIRQSTVSEHRQKSFLIAPKISPPKRAQMKAFNLVPVEARTEDFLSWLDQVVPSLPSRMEILRNHVPDIAAALQATESDPRNRKALTQFSSSFHRVPEKVEQRGVRSLYLLGASPRWEDILQNLDAPREITEKLVEDVNNSLDTGNALEVHTILGSAGSGKSTVLRRAGLNLARSGRTIFLTNSEELPKANDIVSALETFASRCVLLFDNAEISLGQLPSLAETLVKTKRPPILIIASRTNDFDRKASRFSRTIKITEHHVPNLSKKEIEAVIQVLDQNHLLGYLQGMNNQQRVKEFEVRANKQILVAMREATSGKGFDDIIKNEFETLSPMETKILYLCVALATEAGYRITKQEYVGCSEEFPADALHLLYRNLKDIVLATGINEELLGLRHSSIAEYAIKAVAPRPLLRNAYIRLLSVLATEIGGKAWRSRTFSFYRELINHYTIYKRFAEEIEEARSIYDSLSNKFKTDSQFWLQYGSLELETGNLQYAENYLRQAESLDADSLYIQNAKAHLLLKKAIKADTKAEAVVLRDEGSEILLESIRRAGIPDPYCYHIYGSQRYKWMNQWVNDDSERKVELESLRSLLEHAVRDFPRNRQLSGLKEHIDREYMMLAVRP